MTSVLLLYTYYLFIPIVFALMAYRTGILLRGENSALCFFGVFCTRMIAFMRGSELISFVTTATTIKFTTSVIGYSVRPAEIVK